MVQLLSRVSYLLYGRRDAPVVEPETALVVTPAREPSLGSSVDPKKDPVEDIEKDPEEDSIGSDDFVPFSYSLKLVDLEDFDP
ncbi:hypothetical protein FNV43_RR27183 [Rhamnella rubrinervis]|uniref:Uncharacterized protein n=1 Tax=Rhamnella rubrinervis TaxID=2594499 RepID=A0A8K0DNZ1_9ROSA|nr:hypothetical protein FNV43_RR27183 [Rhamnella rubrinervis]